MSIGKTIQSKFTVFSAVAVASVLILVLAGFWTSTEAQSQSHKLHEISGITQRHMEGDMMHDAIRSDVLSALLAVRDGDTAAFRQTKTDLQEHVDNFAANLAANRKENLPTEIVNMLSSADRALTAYAEAARTVMDAADNETSLTAAMEDFNTKFDLMEVENEAISEAILGWSSNVEHDTVAFAQRNLLITGISALIALALVVGLPLFAWRQLFAPLKATTATMQDLAHGNFEQLITGTDRQDEIGDIAKTLIEFKNNGLKRIEAERNQALVASQSEEERKKAFAALATAFESRIEHIIAAVADATEALQDSSKAMSNDSVSANKRAGSVASATQKSNSDLQAVASAAEEMSASINEIAHQMSESSKAINQAVGEMSKADETSRMLDQATLRIGEIVTLIQNITNQINLLALNATIESARAGEAGKGFAIVANEVKTLAGQTAQATEDIVDSIDNIKSVVKDVVGAIHAIKTSVDQVQSISGAISSSVSQQTSVTNEIASNMGRVSHENEGVSRDIAAVSQASEQVSQAAATNFESVTRLRDQTDLLEKEVENFLRDIRAA